MKASIVPPQHWISTILIKLSVYFKGFGGKNIKEKSFQFDGLQTQKLQ